MSIAVPSKNNNTALVFLAFAILYVVWGSTYLAILFALESFPPFFLGAIRFLLAGVIMIGWCIIKKEKFPSAKDLLKISLSGILMLSFGIGAVIWAEQYLPSGITAIIPATMPMWLVILDRRNWKYYFTNRLLIAGILIGFLGVILLVSDKVLEPGSNGKMALTSFFVLAGGAIAWSMGTLYTKYNNAKGSTAMKTAIQMLASGMFSLLISTFNNELPRLSNAIITPGAVWSLLYLVVMGSIVGYLAYVWLISIKPAPIVGTFVYVNPGVALLLGWLIASEPISALQLLAFGIIIAGVLSINLSKTKTVK